MFRLALSRPGPRLLIQLTTSSKRTISTTPLALKRVTRGNIDEIFGKVEEPPTNVKEVDPTTITVKKKRKCASKKAEQEQQSLATETGTEITATTMMKKKKEKSLEPKLESTGSIVLDTVRKYTEQHPDCVLLVQVGEFYELYESHATEYASQLDLKLTRKEMTTGTTVDFAGFPLRSLDRYLDILVNRLGCRVALCEQYNPVKREGDDSVIGIQRLITRVITPGTVIEERFLDSHTYNYLMAISPIYPLPQSSSSLSPSNNSELGLAWIDISVGEFMIQSSTLDMLKDDIARIRPREIILPESFKPLIEDQEQEDLNHPLARIITSNPHISVTFVPQDHFDPDAGRRMLDTLFDTTTTSPAATYDSEATTTTSITTFNNKELGASNALLDYINNTHPHGKPRLLKPVRMSANETLQIDSATVASLELVKNLREGGRTNSLLSCINYTVTNAGARQLAQWLLAPSSSVHTIERRHDIVEFLVSDNFILDDVRSILRESSDAQRALQRLALRRGQHLDLLEIGSTLSAIKGTKKVLMEHVSSATTSNTIQAPSSSSETITTTAINELIDRLNPHDDLANYIDSVIDHERIMSDEAKDFNYGFIRSDFDPQLQHLHQQLDAFFQQKEQLQKTLRSIGGNSVSLAANSSLYRHVVEINATQAKKLVDEYPEAFLVHKTKGKHRFQLPEWTNLSIQIQNTHAQIVELESQIWDKAVDRVLEDSTSIIAASGMLAKLDVFCSFAWMARRYKYIRPVMLEQENGCEMIILGGRHPVVEASLAQKGRSFVKNDCILAKSQDNGGDERSWLLTAPNMGGKSTFLRQNAIIMILAHMGSYVPAHQAKIGVADRIMSRIGTADDLAQDLSTFMIEMMETANILTYATKKSLVIMDEVGRGTATTDGISLAYAILAYIHTHIKSRLIFATHYHELADMVKRKQELAMIQLYKTDLVEDQMGRFVFLHKVQPGVCRKSHGLKVAQLAGLPTEVISTARDVWQTLNKSTTV
ncbi:hypothetical protein INT45_013545 [Circinella minor]|uniref:DNA mismatch repair proteins mutS family domain-containing protein n=1 Tax=Circinella minor TaxID=1195481 RepID=A0A8H7S3L3_9FUNG|nr:hypothetical protein INT45_013545 [Circinella minor]